MICLDFTEKVSRVVNQPKINLVIQPGAKYDFSKLDKFSIKADAEKLQNRLQNLQEKNDAYCKNEESRVVTGPTQTTWTLWPCR